MKISTIDPRQYTRNKYLIMLYSQPGIATPEIMDIHKQIVVKVHGTLFGRRGLMRGLMSQEVRNYYSL